MSKENLYTPDCIRTFTGKYVNVFEPKPEDFCIEDIAHALSNQCRFSGHLKTFYSVAQHCINVAHNVFEGNKLAALLHDASEAYLLDIPSPIKARLSNYKEIEDNLMKVIAEKFNFQYPITDEIKFTDKQMLEFEWDNLMISKKVPEFRIYTHLEAKQVFIHQYNAFI